MPGLKIDLDDLELDAFAAPAGLCPSDHLMCMPPHGCAATRLALITRIRELQVLAGGLIEEIATNLPGSRRGELDEERALLEKGAVLP